MGATNILPVGWHRDVPHAVYHADPCVRPSLSSSVAKVLLSRSPLHAYLEHPQLGASHPVEADISEQRRATLDRGALIHSLLLGNGCDVESLPYADYRTKAARDDRDKARAAGRIPVLVHQLRDLQTAAEALRVNSRLGVLLAEGMVEREVTAVWESDGVLCRGRLDAWEPDALTIHDPKTCENARGASSGNTILRYGWDVQAAAYIQAVETIHPTLAGRVRFRWHFLEVVPPYGCIEAEPTGELLELGRRKWERAVATWGRCLRDDDWPGYPESVLRVEPPGWAMSEDLAEQMEQEGA